jgi:Flp pilus assembly protein TadG
MHQRAERGQSTVETAILLPLVVLLVALIVQVGIVTRDHLALWQTAGTAARLASIDPHNTAAIQTFVDDTLHLAPTLVTVERIDNLVTTSLHHRYTISLLFLDTHIRIFDMKASVTMHVEDVG